MQGEVVGWLVRELEFGAPECLEGLVRGAPSRRLELLGGVVRCQVVADVLPQLVHAVVVERAYGGLLERPHQALGLPVGPGVVGLREPVLDAEAAAHAGEGMVLHSGTDASPAGIAELDAVVGQHGVDAVRDHAGEHLE